MWSFTVNRFLAEFSTSPDQRHDYSYKNSLGYPTSSMNERAPMLPDAKFPYTRTQRSLRVT